MDIFFKSNDGDQDFTRVLYPKGQIVALFTGRAVPPASFYVKSKSIQINGTSMTTVENTGYITGEANAAAAGQYSVGGGSDKIAVIRVIGYRTLEDL